ncbi:hypothetical protein TNCV_1484621 [Trichonephila clavipes]|nr:hypothetical protein TNCV_1484621 [Trichonephila clavipes]
MTSHLSTGRHLSLCGRCRHPKPTRHPAESKSLTPEILEETQKMIWGITSNRNLDRIQILQNRALRLILNAPTYIKRIHIHKDLKIPALTSRIKKLATAFYEQVNAHSNSLINIQAAMDAQRTHNMPIQTTHLRRRF